MHFLDQAKIYIRSGAGGPGGVSFRREKFIQYGGPDGGDGGKGGDIIFEAVPGLNTLIDFRYSQHFKAQRGIPGMGKNRTGAGGDDLIIKVPVGTQVISDDDEGTVLADFTESGQRVTLLRGGDGGRGNLSYKTSTNRAPRQHGMGWPGEEMWVWLRLKLLADVGLVGLPNAGKSTFINQVTNTKAKVGDYPFTTTKPQLGVVQHKGREFVLADIPGLIEGAADGAGIGDRFLGHIERCRVLIHLVDATGDDPVKAWKIVKGELEAYGAGLEDKPQILVLNKGDLLGQELMEDIAKSFARRKAGKPMIISGATGEGVDKLLDAILPLLGENLFGERKAPVPESEAVEEAEKTMVADLSSTSFPKNAVRPEPVEGLSFSSRLKKEGQDFDKLSPNGIGGFRGRWIPGSCHA